MVEVHVFLVSRAMGRPDSEMELFRDLWDYRRAGWAKKYLKKWLHPCNPLAARPDARLRLDVDGHV